MTTSHIKFLLTILFIFGLNALVYYGAMHNFWPWQTVKYLFWGESILLGVAALFAHAKQMLVFFLLLLFIGYIMGYQNLLFMGDLKIPVTFWSFYSLFWLLYFQMRTSRTGHRLRLLHPFYQLVLYLASMSFAIVASFCLTGYLFFGQLFIPVIPGHVLQQFIVMMAGIPTLTIVILKIVDMIGERHVFYFLLGTYHRPIEKKQIVLFLDMAGSSTVVEKLSPKKSMEMIAQFIFDAGSAFRSQGGDIVNYTGDGLVVLWPLHKADRVLAAFEALDSRLRENKSKYERNFGTVPDFRIGVHAGSIVISQIGAEKLFLGVYGDVVNTAARIEQMNKDFGTRLLFSKAVKQQLTLSFQKRIKSMGRVEVRGREEDIEVFTVF